MRVNSSTMALLSLLCMLPAATPPVQAAQATVASIPPSVLLQPEDLAASLASAAVPRPLILQVGFRILYTQAHIPGSEYAGPANNADGLRLLTGRVAPLSKGTPIVIYCGCCPWSHCPNIAAAYARLHALGFEHVRVLYIADNFGENWVNRGYPVATGD